MNNNSAHVHYSLFKRQHWAWITENNTVLFIIASMPKCTYLGQSIRHQNPTIDIKNFDHFFWETYQPLLTNANVPSSSALDIHVCERTYNVPWRHCLHPGLLLQRGNYGWTMFNSRHHLPPWWLHLHPEVTSRQCWCVSDVKTLYIRAPCVA